MQDDSDVMKSPVCGACEEGATNTQAVCTATSTAELRPCIHTNPLHGLPQCVHDLLAQSELPTTLPAINSSLGIQAVFVTHYTPLKHRKPIILERVRQAFDAEPVFVNKYDKETLSMEQIDCMSDRVTQLQFIERHTTTGEDSLSFKHMAVFYHMLKMGLDMVIVMEDDAFLFDKAPLHSNTQWNTIMQDLPADFDLVMMSKQVDIRHEGPAVGEYLVLAQQAELSSMYLISNKVCYT